MKHRSAGVENYCAVFVVEDEFARRCPLPFSTPLPSASFFVKHYAAINFTGGTFPSVKMGFQGRFFFDVEESGVSQLIFCFRGGIVSLPHTGMHPQLFYLEVQLGATRHRHVNTRMSSTSLF